MTTDHATGILFLGGTDILPFPPLQIDGAVHQKSYPVLTRSKEVAACNWPVSLLGVSVQNTWSFISMPSTYYHGVQLEHTHSPVVWKFSSTYNGYFRSMTGIDAAVVTALAWIAAGWNGSTWQTNPTSSASCPHSMDVASDFIFITRNSNKMSTARRVTKEFRNQFGTGFVTTLYKPVTANNEPLKCGDSPGNSK